MKRLRMLGMLEVTAEARLVAMLEEMLKEDLGSFVFVSAGSFWDSAGESVDLVDDLLEVAKVAVHLGHRLQLSNTALLWLLPRFRSLGLGLQF